MVPDDNLRTWTLKFLGEVRTSKSRDLQSRLRSRARYRSVRTAFCLARIPYPTRPGARVLAVRVRDPTEALSTISSGNFEDRSADSVSNANHAISPPPDASAASRSAADGSHRRFPTLETYEHESARRR